jgi:phage baseplate assembly protein W
MFPEIAQLEFKPQEPASPQNLGKSFLFDFKKGDFILRDGKLVEVEGIEALKVGVEKLLRTEKFKFKIYERDDKQEYGVTIEDLIGSSLPKAFVESELKREISDALKKHPMIAGISNLSTLRDGSRLKISFQINLVDGQAIGQEVVF